VEEFMMYRRSSQVVRLLLLASVIAVLPLHGAAQAAPAGSQSPTPSQYDIFGGYSYYHPISFLGNFGDTLDGFTYKPIVAGGIGSFSAYLDDHIGFEFEGSASPHGPNDCSYTAQVGPIVRAQTGRYIPFAHLLYGAARDGGPALQPCTWGYGATIGAGFDYVLPEDFLRNRISVRPIQADMEFSVVNFGDNTAPTFLNGGIAKITAFRLSSGIVYRIGGTTEVPPAAYGCVVQPVTVFPGDPITVTGSVINLESGKRMKPVYTWSTNGGQVEGDSDTATISTAGLDAGDYTVTGRVSEGFRTNQHAECAASFRIQAFDPPTLSCSANPSSILPGGISTITSEGRSPQNRPLSYSYTASAGAIGGNGTTGALTTAGVSPGTIDVTCNVVDDLGKTATSTTTVTVVAPPPPLAPAARNLCSISFDRDRKRPVRVDNEAKGCLDDIALELNRESDAALVVVGKHDPQETPEAAAQRAINVKLYLTTEKGIDASRIDLRTGESTGRSTDNILVPRGATWDPGGTTQFDPSKVTPAGEPYARPPR
jgi:hypothetical protein